MLLLSGLGCSVDMNRDRPSDVAIDGKLEPDTVKQDGPRVDQAIDGTPALDQANDVETKDVAPDQGGDLGIVLVHGGFSTGGPGSGAGIVLAEAGFELGETLCNSTANICVTGGIVP